MAFSTPIHTNEQSVDRVLGAGLPVLLVFERKDCVPCQQIEPALARLAAAYAGKVLLARVGTQDNPGLVQRYGITRLPGLVFVKGGAPVAQSSGAAPEPMLRAWLDYLIGGGTRPELPSGPHDVVAPLHPAAERQREGEHEGGPPVGLSAARRRGGVVARRLRRLLARLADDPAPAPPGGGDLAAPAGQRSAHQGGERG